MEVKAYLVMPVTKVNGSQSLSGYSSDKGKANIFRPFFKGGEEIVEDFGLGLG
jgi:hypothetical protein